MADTGPQVPRLFGGPSGWISVAVPLVLFIWFLQFIPAIAAGETLRWSMEWVPSLDVAISFWLDGLSLTFALLITGIGALVTLYSAQYLGTQPQYPRFILFLMAFMIGMLGLVLADNLLALFVFWEVTTISSYLLIGYLADEAKSRRSALQALLVTGTGGLAFLAGIVLIGFAAGSFELSEIRDVELRDHPWIVAISILFLAGAFTKSAQFPFHFWLPNAMAAPTPVSAYLHSATMVKAGIYLMARMNPTLGGTDLWFWSLTIAGGFTAVFASILAMRQSDIKQVLAYTTLMALGTLTLFIGAGTSAAIKGAMLFLIVHSLYKAALFLMIGIVDHRTGSREAEVLSGLSRKMPLTALAAVLAALSMAGIPPLIGFIGKEFLYKAALSMPTAQLWITGTAFAASALMFAVGGIVALRPFFGKLGDTPKAPREGPIAMLVGPLILAGLGLALGVNSDWAETLVRPATAAVYGSPVAVDLYLYKEVNAALILSLVTFATGIVLYLGHRRLRARLASIESWNPIHFDRGWDRFLDGFAAFAKWQAQKLQHGVLRRYIFVIFAFLGVTAAYAMWLRDAWQVQFDFTGVAFRDWAVLIFITAGAFVTATANSRMTAVAALGVVGIGVALIFIMFGAPDVAITQLLVETLVVVLVALAMLKLPYLNPKKIAEIRGWDALVAILVGTTSAIVLLASMAEPLDRRLTDYFELTSWPEAYGRNVVNVILVDFRALDTFGEIAVVMIAALGAFVLLRGTPKGEEK